MGIFSRKKSDQNADDRPLSGSAPKEESDDTSFTGIPMSLFKKIRQIEIRTKGLVDSVFGGEYHSAFKGRGIEFREVRPYQIGDDIRSIDWNVSARTGDTFVKVFEEEREQTLMMVVDISGSENFGTDTQFKREVAAEICAVVAFSAIRNNDKVGLLLFSDQVELFVPPKKGQTHVLRLIRDLFAHKPISKATDMQIALDHIMRVLRRRSIVLLISDFLEADFARSLKLVANRHDTIAVHLFDPREESLPEIGLLEVTDAETGERTILDTNSKSFQRQHSEAVMDRRMYLSGMFRQMKLGVIEVNIGEDYVDPLTKFFRHRNKSKR